MTASHEVATGILGEGTWSGAASLALGFPSAAENLERTAAGNAGGALFATALIGMLAGIVFWPPATFY